MKKQHTHSGKGRPLVAMALLGFLAFVPFGGCALIVGIEKQESTFDPNDPYNGLVVDDLCREYCDEVQANCLDPNDQYLALRNCVFTCMALDPGTENEAAGNNVKCRLRKAESARGAAAAEVCQSAGPVSPDCGDSDNCGTWCRLLEHECPKDFGALEDCEKACESIPDRGSFDTDDDYENVDNIQCRILHLGSVGSLQSKPDESHCDHGSYIPLNRCRVTDDTVPACDDYCRVIMVNCDGADQVYDSEEQCLAACEVLDPGEFSNNFDDTRNTVGCRTYHAKVAALVNSAETHCKHAGPTGSGVCGTYADDDNITGTCESYCRYLAEGCGDAFDAAFDNESDCAASCKIDFAGNGADPMSSYSVDTAPDGNTLQCRTYHAILALSEAAKDDPDVDRIAPLCAAAAAAPDEECEVP